MSWITHWHIPPSDQARCTAAYLGPLRHLPLGSTALALTNLSIGRFVQVVRQTQRVVDGGVEAGGEHLPAAHRAVLDALATRPRALAPTARLPPEDAIRVTTVSFHTQIFSGN